MRPSGGARIDSPESDGKDGGFWMNVIGYDVTVGCGFGREFDGFLGYGKGGDDTVWKKYILKNVKVDDCKSIGCHRWVLMKFFRVYARVGGYLG